MADGARCRGALVMSVTPFPTVHKDAKAVAQAENWEALNALYPAALEALRERLATCNDMAAVKLIVELCAPKQRAVALNDISPAGIREAIRTGRLSPNEGAAVAAAVKSCADIETLDALALRIEAIERAIGAA